MAAPGTSLSAVFHYPPQRPRRGPTPAEHGTVIALLFIRLIPMLILAAPALAASPSLPIPGLRGLGLPAARPAAVQAPTAERTRGSLSALVIFAKFSDEATSETAKPPWADDLFSPDRPGSFTHFYDEMSRGQLQVTGEVLPRRYSSRQPASAYVASEPGTFGQYGRFNLEILEQVDADTNLGRFDNDGPDGVPNSGDDDGYVDVVFINLLTVPPGFFIGTATGLASLGLDNDFISDDSAAGGGGVRVRSRFSGFGGTTQRGHVFSVTAATMCHEFGHVLGLPDLFDQSSVTRGNELDPAEDSAGIGKWGIMGLGTLGWGVEDGPNAFSAWSLMTLGWLGQDNENLVEVTQSQRSVVIEQIDRGGEVYKVPLSPEEYFLIENRQATGSYYNRNVPAGGLLVWHVDERADNDEEHHKKVDLVCADGLYADSGFPGTAANAVAGGDNLDFWARDNAYAAAHNGNQGDATDPFDGVRYTRFAHDTNPGALAYTGAGRNTPLGLVLENIRVLSGGRMQVDILIRQPVPGNVSADTTWSGTVEVAGDVVVEAGATLTLAPGTEVRFAARDARAAGFDTSRCELLVYGDLAVEGDAEAPVALRSARSVPGRRDWVGVLLLAGQSPELEQVQAAGGLVIANAQFGLLRSRLPAGRTTWLGQVQVPWDVTVPAGSELVLEPGTSIRFAPEDAGHSGISPYFTELAVAGRLTVQGDEGRAVLMTVDAFGKEAFWYGIRLLDGGSLEADHLQVSLSGFGLTGQVAEGAVARLRDSSIRQAITGVNLTVFGEVALERTTVSDAFFQGVRFQGPGVARLRSTVIRGAGQEGISLGNAGLDGEDVQLADNGGLDPEDPRSGVVTEGGRGQRLVLRRSAVRGSRKWGLDLTAWEGAVELVDAEVVGNRGGGLLAKAVEHLTLDRTRVEANQGAGATVEGAPVLVREASFAGNGGSGLVLRNTSGAVESSAFVGEGLRVEASEGLAIQGNTFDGAPVAVESADAAPDVAGNRFEGNALALKVTGPRVPVRVAGNIFVDNAVAIRNLTAGVLKAEGNYWGTLDGDLIAGLVEGSVDWTPFLESEPTVTAVVEGEEVPLPGAFALYPSYPNPFNSTAVIAFDLAAAGPAELTVLDVLGRRVRALVSEPLAPGRHVRQWDGRDDGGRDVASGVYVYRLSAGDRVETGKIALVR